MNFAARLEDLGDRILGRWPRSLLVEGDAGTAELDPEPAVAFRIIVWSTVALVVLQSVLHLVDAAVFDLQIARLDADSDKSVWSWLGSASELTAAFGAALLLLGVPGRRRSLIFLTLVLGFFSMDDTVRIHEGLGNLGLFASTGLSARVLWPLIYAPLLVLTCTQLWRTSGAMVERCRYAVRGGLVMLAVAVVLEFFASTLIIKAGAGRVADDTRVGSMLYELEVVVEEALELGGWLLIAAGLVATGLDVLIKRARVHARG